MPRPTRTEGNINAFIPVVAFSRPKWTIPPQLVRTNNPVNFQIPEELAIILTVRHCPLCHAAENTVSMALSTSEARGFEHWHLSKGPRLHANQFHSPREICRTGRGTGSFDLRWKICGISRDSKGYSR
jgi:hypothetical protein